MKREVIVRRAFPCGQALAGVAIVWMLGATFMADPRTMRILGESGVDIARRRPHAEDRRRHQARLVMRDFIGMIAAVLIGACVVAAVRSGNEINGRPSATRAVDDLASRKCTQRRWIDPWGMSYAVYCGNGINLAQSFGPDRIANTTDDIWSNR